MKDNGPKNWTAALGRHASMAQERRFEAAQREIERVRNEKDRTNFLTKVENSRFRSAELVNGNGFIAISESWVDDFGSGPVAVFHGFFQKKPGFWTENDLKNFCL